MKAWTAVGLFLVMAGAGCGRSLTFSASIPVLVPLDSGSPSGPGGAGGAGPVPTGCRTEFTSTHPLIKLTLPDQPCTFTLAEAKKGIAFRYRVEVSAGASVLMSSTSTVPPGFSCPRVPPSKVFVSEIVSGQGQRYCLCDTGHCPAKAPLANPPVGNTDVTFDWDGVNWSGPSDFGNPKGAAFGPGDYAFEVKAKGTFGSPTVPWEAVAKLPFTLTP